MTATRNTKIARRFFHEILAGGHDDAAESLIAPDAVVQLPPERFSGPDGVRKLGARLRYAFPDLRIELEDLHEIDDRVVTRWTLHGTQRGEFMHHPPSGKKTRVEGLSLFRIENGQIVEHWMEER
jgi:steroid delta-isomerase-like uncharacterized protein